MSTPLASSHEHLLAGSSPVPNGRARRTIRLEVPLARIADIASFLPEDLKRLSPEISLAIRAEQSRHAGERRAAGQTDDIFPRGRTVRLMPVDHPNHDWDGKRTGRLHRPMSTLNFICMVLTFVILGVFLIIAVAVP